MNQGTGRLRPHGNIFLWGLAALLLALAALAAFSPASRGATVEESANLAMSQTVTAAEAMETYATDNNGSYRHATVRRLRLIEPSLEGARLNVYGNTNNYRVAVWSAARPTVVFRLTRRGGVVKRTCAPRGRATCTVEGTWAKPAPPTPTPESIDAEAKAGVVTAAEAMETCATDHNGVYEINLCRNSYLEIIEPTLQGLGVRFAAIPRGDSYEVKVLSDRDHSVLFGLIRTQSGTTFRYCTVPAGLPRGGCPEDNRW